MQPESITTSGHCSFLRRRYPTRFNYLHGIIGPIPLVDLAILLTLFVIAHSWIVMRPGIRLELPQVEFMDGARRGTAIVTVTAGNLLFFEDQRTTIAALADQLRNARAAADGVPSLMIQADRRSQHDVVMQIYSLAAAAGFAEVMMATQLPRPEDVTP